MWNKTITNKLQFKNLTQSHTYKLLKDLILNLFDWQLSTKVQKMCDYDYLRGKISLGQSYNKNEVLWRWLDQDFVVGFANRRFVTNFTHMLQATIPFPLRNCWNCTLYIFYACMVQSPVRGFDTETYLEYNHFNT